jgi:glycosyltransferase involved in cell wall biosynthesis
MTTATVVVTTRNRRDELRTALHSAIVQSVPVELVVVDDGSDDGTSEMVRTEFPTAVLIRNESSLGYIAARNLAATSAGGDLVFSIDDDAAFSTPFCVEQTMQEFDHPRIGAVAVPFINVYQDGALRQRAPAWDGTYVTASYIGTAHAVRRELFLRLGAYRADFVHQGEEGDFCLRLLDAGYVVRLGTADPIHHFESPQRDFRRMDYYGKRNLVLHTWHNVPWPFFPAHLAVTTIKGTWHGLRLGRPAASWAGLANGFGCCLTGKVRRQPVSGTAYRLFRRLTRGPLPLAKVEPFLRVDKISLTEVCS